MALEPKPLNYHRVLYELVVTTENFLANQGPYIVY